MDRLVQASGGNVETGLLDQELVDLFLLCDRDLVGKPAGGNAGRGDALDQRS